MSWNSSSWKPGMQVQCVLHVIASASSREKDSEANAWRGNDAQSEGQAGLERRVQEQAAILHKRRACTPHAARSALCSLRSNAGVCMAAQRYQ